MLPVLVSLGPFSLYSYGVMLLVALILSMYVIWKRARELHFDEEILFDALFVGSLWMIVGGRIGYVLWHIPDFWKSIWQVINLWGKPGLWLGGGLLAGIYKLKSMAKQFKWDIYLLGDVIAPGFLLGQALISLGDFLNGSNLGNVTDSFVGMQFVGMYDKHIPVQLIAFGLQLLFFWVLWWVEGAYRTFSWYKGAKSEANSGFVGAAYLCFTGLTTFFVSLMKPPELLIGNYGVDWLWGLILVGLGVMLFHRRAGINYSRMWQNRQQNALKAKQQIYKRSLGIGENIFD